MTFMVDGHGHDGALSHSGQGVVARARIGLRVVTAKDCAVAQAGRQMASRNGKTLTLVRDRRATSGLTDCFCAAHQPDGSSRSARNAPGALGDELQCLLHTELVAMHDGMRFGEGGKALRLVSQRTNRRKGQRFALLLCQVGGSQQLLERPRVQWRPRPHRAGYFSQRHVPIPISHRIGCRMQLANQRPSDFRAPDSISLWSRRGPGRVPKAPF